MSDCIILLIEFSSQYCGIKYSISYSINHPENAIYVVVVILKGTIHKHIHLLSSLVNIQGPW